MCIKAVYACCMDRMKVLERAPHDYEALYDLGLSLAHMATNTRLPPRARQQHLNQVNGYMTAFGAHFGYTTLASKTISPIAVEPSLNALPLVVG